MTTDSDKGQIRLEDISGPGTPLNAAVDGIEPHGYVEQEFQLSGLASRYRMADSDADAERLDGGHPYTTRLLVRRPRDPARFNGTVIVEWLNVSAGQDVDFVYAATRELILREGYAWVGASVQRAGVECLVAWNPQRYGGLSVAAPLDDPETGAPLDPAHAFTGAAGGDVLCWDIYTQIAKTLICAPENLLGTAAVRHVLAAGESQSAFRLSRYFNSIQPLQGLYAGFLLYDRGGPHALRADVAAKLISMGSDFFAEYAGGPPAQDADNQRWWELAGSSHVSLAEMDDYVDPQILRDGVLRLDGRAATLSEVLERAHPDARGPLWSRVPNGDLMKAALNALNRWIAFGTAPTSAPRLVLDDQGRLMRDAEGRTAGGVRFAAYEVPVSINVGVSDKGPRIAGYHLDFTPEDLARRYGTPATYLEKVTAAVETNLAQGFLLAEDALRVIAEARSVRFEG